MTDHNDQQRAELLEAFAPLRVADVSDGMDWNSLHDLGLVDAAIRPLFRPLRVCGIALTARYVPTDKKIPSMSPEAYDAFSSDWYRNVCTYPFAERIRPGDFVVIDASNLDVGLLGSNNVLSFINKGATGIATNGGCRDTDAVPKGPELFS